MFVYRGNGFERLADFTSRILDQFPNAELMKKLTPPSDEVKESPQQCKLMSGLPFRYTVLSIFLIPISHLSHLELDDVCVIYFKLFDKE